MILLTVDLSCTPSGRKAQSPDPVSLSTTKMTPGHPEDGGPLGLQELPKVMQLHVCH